MKIRPIFRTDLLVLGLPDFLPMEQMWVLDHGQVVGCIGYAPLPGLPQIADVYGVVLPQYRRQGFGRYLFNFLISTLRQDTDIKQISIPVLGFDDPLATMFLQRGFAPEHEEIDLKITAFPMHPHPAMAGRLIIQHHQSAQTRLRMMYDETFCAYPWYQPYFDNAELQGELGEQFDLFFLQDQGEIIGFAATRYEHYSADIEPFGILPKWQGQGWGRRFLRELLYEIGRKKCAAAQITTWANNLPALNLYQSVGFFPITQRAYLTYDL